MDARGGRAGDWKRKNGSTKVTGDSCMTTLINVAFAREMAAVQCLRRGLNTLVRPYSTSRMDVCVCRIRQNNYKSISEFLCFVLKLNILQLMQINKIQTLFQIQRRKTCLFKVGTLPVLRARDWKKQKSNADFTNWQTDDIDMQTSS